MLLGPMTNRWAVGQMLGVTSPSDIDGLLRYLYGENQPNLTLLSPVTDLCVAVVPLLFNMLGWRMGDLTSNSL